jgi:hypothetical protein
MVRQTPFQPDLFLPSELPSGYEDGTSPVAVQTALGKLSEFLFFFTDSLISILIQLHVSQ